MDYLTPEARAKVDRIEAALAQPPAADSFTEELVLRLVDAADVLAAATTDEDGELDAAHAHGLLSALDYALRGDAGCVEPDEWQERRRQALAKYGVYLGLGESA
jgi:hypothetical protein